MVILLARVSSICAGSDPLLEAVKPIAGVDPDWRLGASEHRHRGRNFNSFPFELQPLSPTAVNMPENGKAISEESFEFIDTPPVKEFDPAPNCGVRTTSV